MLKKIISGGQTGADRAALDTAIRHNIPHGGWIPKGRIAEDGRLPGKYKLQETISRQYSFRTKKNIMDSDATLIISHGVLASGSLLTRQLAERSHKRWLHIDLEQRNEFPASLSGSLWILENKIEVLNVAGPRTSRDPDIYQSVTHILDQIIDLLRAESMALSLGPARTLPILTNLKMPSRYPKTVDGAVDQLMYQLSLKDKVSIARMAPEEISLLNLTMGRYIKNKFGLRFGNSNLMRSCRNAVGKDCIEIDEASAAILAKLFVALKDTHLLRLVK
jgi:Circularly permutated YpsA SLOG family/Domain of unknown function (DUF6794)